MVGLVATDADAPAAKRLKANEDDAMPDAAEDQSTSEKQESEDFSSWPVQNLMKLYYSRIFPHKDFYKWLAYGHDGKHPGSDQTFFRRREFCFTLDGDIFVRYQSFKDGADLAAALAARLPAKIDLGPVYTADPQQRKTYGDSFKPESREFVFDIDVTDYDNVRTCCKAGDICTKCWSFMAVAIKILDRGLREDFGFQNILWVFSGRRGIHCWVCDARARQMTDDQRAAVANYFAVYKGEEEGLARITLGTAGEHPLVSESYTLLEQAWVEDILLSQELLDDAQHRATILRYIPDAETQADVAAALQSNLPVAERWQKLKDICAQASKERQNDSPAEKKLKSDIGKAPKRIVLGYTYPRLDIEVSKKMNHLLKTPFCVHPKTGKVCVPLDPASADAFNPETVPTVGSLLNELNANASPGNATKGEEWEQTSMAPVMQMFRQQFLKGLQAANHTDLTLAKKIEAAAGNHMQF